MKITAWKWIALVTVALTMAACNKAEEGTTTVIETTTPSTTTETKVDAGATATTPAKATDAQVAEAGATDAKPASVKGENPKTAEQEKATGSRTAAKTDPKAASAKEEAVTAVGPDGKEVKVETDSVPLNAPNTTKPAPATPAKPPTPKNANLSASTASFTGKWKRFIDADTMKKYQEYKAKVKGKKFFPTDNILTLNPDGTFIWDDNALIVGRKVEGTWTVKNGTAQFKIVKVNGQAPKKTDSSAFIGMVSKDGKQFYRQGNEKSLYNRI